MEGMESLKGWNLSRDGISQGMESIMSGNYQEKESLKGWNLSRVGIYHGIETIKGRNL